MESTPLTARAPHDVFPDEPVPGLIRPPVSSCNTTGVPDIEQPDIGKPRFRPPIFPDVSFLRTVHSLHRRSHAHSRSSCRHPDRQVDPCFCLCLCGLVLPRDLRWSSGRVVVALAEQGGVLSGVVQLEGNGR